MNPEVHLFPVLLDPAQLPGPVLVVMPHPDDEVIGCGGMMAFHRQAAQAVSVIHASAGEGGDPEGRFADLGALRELEVKRALEILDVPEPRCLGCRDGELGAVDNLDEQLSEIFRATEFSTLYLPSPLDCHCDHRVLAHAIARVAPAVCPAETVCMLTGINNPGLPNTLVDITRVLELKENALRCFETQLSFLDFATKVMWSDQAATVNIENQAVKACEMFMRLPVSDLTAFFKQAAAIEEVLYGG